MELRHGALKAFTLADPAAKVVAVQELWAQCASLAIDTECHLQPPLHPGRPAKPVLILPKEVPRRSPYTPEGHVALIHSIAHIEFNAINLALDAAWRFAGMPADYLLNQMKDMKSGARANGQSAEVMKPMVADLTEDEMKAMADYVASLKEAPTAASAAPATAGKTLFLTKTCVACHGKEGKKPLPGYPAIGGQDKAYIIAQAKDIKSGARANGKSNAMQPVMHLVNDDEITAVAEYLSTVK